MRLRPALLESLPSSVGRFAYDRDAQAIGIIHLGLGAFHRAHQAIYTDRAMSAGDRDWAICGVSLRSPAVHDQMVPQECLYSLTERGEAGEATAIVGSIRSVVVGREDPAAAVAALVLPTVRIVTLTVTEKGYHTSIGGGLAADSADIAHDLSGAPDTRTIYGYLRDGLARRRAAGLPGLSIISCDNLADNGPRLAAGLAQFLDRADSSLRQWVEAECSTPATMVDRIVPATTAEQVAGVEARLGCRDEAAVLTEPFSQWIIEDKFAGPRPHWDAVGARLVADVKAYEVAKLRMLNGAHSALAYLGLRQGHTFVHEAVDDARIRPLISRLMLDEAASTLPQTPGLDPQAYARDLMERFANPCLDHRLEQIAMDGSQKIPERWLPTLRFHQREGRQCPAILTALAAWILHVRPGGHTVADPMAETLAEIWRQAGAQGVVRSFFGSNGLFAGDWEASPADIAFLELELQRTARGRL